jgi:hypothetical protein
MYSPNAYTVLRVNESPSTDIFVGDVDAVQQFVTAGGSGGPSTSGVMTFLSGQPTAAITG